MRVVQWIFPMLSSFGGRENFVTNLARDLRHVGDEALILAIDPELDQPAFADAEVSGEPVRHIGVAGLLAKRPGIFKDLYDVFEAELAAFKPDVIHAHNPEGPDLILLRALSKQFDVPVVMTIHGPLMSSTEAAQSAMRLVEGLCSYVATISDFSYSETLKTHPNLVGKLKLVMNGVPTTRIAQRELRASANQPPTIYASGRFSPEKGFAQLLAAFAIVRQVHPAAQLVIAGKGLDEPLLRKYASSIGLDDAIQFPGWLGPAQVEEALATASMVVVPSVWDEPFGLVAIEAMQAGLPVIASNRGALPEIVRHQETGLIFQSGDIFELASSIRLLLDEPETARAFGRRGQEVAALRFSQRRCTLEYRRIYFSATDQTLNFSVSELQQIGSSGDFSFYPSDFGVALQKLQNVEKIGDGLSRSKAITICKLTHDDYSPLPTAITDSAVVFRTSMLSSLEYHNEYPLPVLISGAEYEDWKPVPKGEEPHVGFVGWAQADLFHRAVSQRSSGDVSQVGLKTIDQTHADEALLKQPMNIGLMLRKRALATLQQSELVNGEFLVRDAYHFDGQEKTVLEQKRLEYLDNLRRNPYSLCIRGAGNYSIRLYETLAAGRIPIILNTSLVLPLDGLVPWRELGVWVELDELAEISVKIHEYHQRLNDEQFLERQRQNRIIWQNFLAPNTFWNHAMAKLSKGGAK